MALSRAIHHACALDVRDTLQKKLGVDFRRYAPMQTIAAGSSSLAPIAEEVRGKLERVLAALP